MKKRSAKVKLKRLEELRKRMHICQNCKLAGSRHLVVFGDGSVNADILVVGEAPGVEENFQGKPFVGSSGKKLSIILKSLGADKVKMFITNVVKCRPPRNRIPSKTEIMHCLPWLKAELDIVGPLVIIPLGRTAMDTVFKMLDISYEGGITANRGKTFSKDGVGVFPTFHPSYILRHRELSSEVRSDLKRAIDSAKRRR